jgi:hypothetical protein
MIRIKLLDGEVVETRRHTYEQATAAMEAGVGIKVGGPDEMDPHYQPPVRTLYPQGIEWIEDVP